MLWISINIIHKKSKYIAQRVLRRVNNESIKYLITNLEFFLFFAQKLFKKIRNNELYQLSIYKQIILVVYKHN